MENRFKFRVWDKKTKSYIYDDFAIHSQGHFFNISCISSGDVIIEQCTGLSDKNGKLMYEGDKVKKHEKLFIDVEKKDFTKDEVLALLKDEVNCKNPEIIKYTVEECDEDFWLEIWYKGIEDEVVMNRFPRYWLKDESFGYEGEDLEDWEDWEIIGNIHKEANND